MRRGFTMIELIFVIVILGILAAVAIPKLAATRSDAEGSKIASDLATCIGDAGGAYLKNGDFSSVNTDGDDTTWTAAKTSSPACKSAITCFNLESNAGNGTLKVEGIANPDAKCTEALRIAKLNQSAGDNGSPVTHSF